MAKRFTERAQRAILIAQEEARRWQNDHVEPLHLLAGIVAVGEGVACQLIASAKISLRELEEKGKTLHGYPTNAMLGEIAFTPEAKKILEFAVEEAHNLGHAFIGTEHLLLGLLHIESSAVFLAQKKLTLDGTRKAVLEVVRRGHIQRPTREQFSMNYFGQQLMVITLERDVRGVLLTRQPSAEQEPAVIVLLEEGADIDRTYQALESVLPQVRYLYFKKPGKRAVTWTEGHWKENFNAEEVLEF